MRYFFPVLFFLALAWTSAAAADHTRVVSFPSCSVIVLTPAPVTEPPAWMVLAGAVALLGAGRLAGSQASNTMRRRRTARSCLRHR